MKNVQIDEIIRSKRRNLCLVVSTDAKLTVKAPLRCSNKLIQEAVEKHRDWILHKQQYAREHFKPASPKKFEVGNGYFTWAKNTNLLSPKWLLLH